MKYFMILLALIGFAGIPALAFADFDKSILEPFQSSDLVIIGEVIQVNPISSENKTQYDIRVEEYLKGQRSFDMITAILDSIGLDSTEEALDYYNKPYFEKENQVLVYLKQEDGIFKMSPYSFTIKRPFVVGPPIIIHPTGPQGHFFSQGDEIVISGNIKKGYLYNLAKSNLDSSFHIVVLNEKGQVGSEKLNISPDGSYRFSFQDKDELRIPGNYSWDITYENGRMGGEFVVVPDFDRWAPLKQIKSGVSLIDVKCSEGKHLVYKSNKLRAACVSEETQNELWSRGWATMRFYTEAETSSHALCNNYQGKWHQEYEGCRGDITDLQCSLMGGKFVDGLKICYNEVCPADKTYTLCVTNLETISREKENEN